ncbi:MAG: acetylglutamate kinase [Candidatus Omnitrophica bacterium CG07_land_8_20_14_0_80_42_15]|uniref:Acetylglutamate kinase n=1 Tax=Candidatus Aquitaenariimonas noxiae TaxID=1974741 RepID=A0A2J0KTG5_9BACT|nr:MAG: acetylglutamate kinase [Candidatus Omnitrophica bacterium CG07_land_8_20_14_0_80_42_15]
MEEAIRKSDILIEALPYIKTFYNKVILIKYGGSAITDDAVRRNVLEDIVFMNYAGMKPVLIHGGGPLISKKMDEIGKKVEFVDGQRVTDEEAIDIVDEVLWGLNKKLVEEFKSLGVQSYGLSGKDAGLIKAKKIIKEKDIGYVGEITSVDTTLLTRLIETDVIPVISSLAKGEDGKIYNINADSAAAKIAVALGAEKIVLLSNVKGIMRDINNENTLYDSLTTADVEVMIEKGIIVKGMIPKAQACLVAIRNGVKKAHIVDCRIPHALLLEIFTDKGMGTEITKLNRRTKASQDL